MPPQPFPRDFARTLPKAELHVHLEGTVDAQSLLALCDRHGVSPPAPDVDGVNEWYRFEDFSQFLERYFAVIAVIRDAEDFAYVAERYLATAHAQGAVHVELHVSACGHIVENEKSWAPIHTGIVAGCRRAQDRTGISWGLIPDISPHLPAADCARAIDEVLAHDLTGVVAIGMGGPATTWFTDDFAPIFDAADAAGLHRVSHAGEHGGPEEVDWAIETFRAERIQHGIGAMSDPAVVAKLIDRGVACDVCPGSNLALHAVDSAETHPLPSMIDAGVVVTIGSDDPPMFQTSLLDDYERAWRWCDLDKAGLVQLAANSLSASFADRADKARWLTQLSDYRLGS